MPAIFYSFFLISNVHLAAICINGNDIVNPNANPMANQEQEHMSHKLNAALGLFIYHAIHALSIRAFCAPGVGTHIRRN